MDAATGRDGASQCPPTVFPLPRRRLTSPACAPHAQAAHTPTISRSAVGGALPAGEGVGVGAPGATAKLLSKAASALADGPLAMGAVSSFKQDPVREALAAKEQHPNHHTNPLAGGPVSMARSSSGNPFSGEVGGGRCVGCWGTTGVRDATCSLLLPCFACCVIAQVAYVQERLPTLTRRLVASAHPQVPSFCVRTNDACSLNNTPASSINGLPLSARIVSPEGLRQAGGPCTASTTAGMRPRSAPCVRHGCSVPCGGFLDR